ncbi:MAG: DNA (cytosine-5-)-methyltransferase [Firmicutes bacterium]|nr:DNA (cytosine-5-)-methyltransferase [Bacillota bacterium]
MNNRMVSRTTVADILSVSKYTLERWEENNKLVPQSIKNGEPVYSIEQLKDFKPFSKLLNSSWDEECKIKPAREYTSVELFSGAGGLALGLEQAGFTHLLLNELDPDACNTLRFNRPNWRVIEADVSQLDFSAYQGKVDLVAGGFPCQAFSYAGNKLGFQDTRGTLFFEFARAVNEIKPKIFLAENVRGLMSHDKGRTLQTMQSVMESLGYTLIEPKVLKAMFYKVPQKRERLFLIGIRNDLANGVEYQWPSPYYRVLTLRDAFYAGELYDTDVPESEGQEYPLRKKQIMEKVPPGGYWKDLPIELQKEYMKKSFYLSGGKTGVARRLSLDEPSLTLTCSPAQKQTERCHPIETRPLQIREYARIQTFPDAWQFYGSLSSKYKQIGNAVPVNLAAAVGRSLVRLLNDIEAINN